MIGAQLTEYELRTIEPGPFEALKMSVAQNWTWSKLIVQTLGGLFTRDTSVKQLMGPVAIADLSGTAAEQGWVALFSLMAMISLNLGLLNLMPIPVLDGGHIAILALEGRVAPRLQHEGEGEDAARRLRPAPDADGHGHLQRPDAHPVDRKTGALALKKVPGVRRGSARSYKVQGSGRVLRPHPEPVEPNPVEHRRTEPVEPCRTEPR